MLCRAIMMFMAIDHIRDYVARSAQQFLLIAPPSMGSPSEFFPIDYGFPLWTVDAVGVVVLLLL
jgi:hypothetical protein